MRPGFRESELIDAYMRQMSPWVKRRSDGLLVPLIDNYTAEMRGIGVGKVNARGEPIPPSDKQREYHKKLFGSDLIEAAPWLYHDSLAMNESGLAGVWETLPVRVRARIKATQRLKGMVDILQRHRDLQDEQMKKTGFGGAI